MLPTNVRRARALAFSEADQQGFKAAMRQLASSVCVVTLGEGEDRNGLTATSVSSLSVEPPTLSSASTAHGRARTAMRLAQSSLRR